jgi:hypothetical protein
MVHDPSKGDLDDGEVVLGRDFLNHGERLKRGVLEVSGAIVCTSARLGPESRVLVVGKVVLGLDLAREETSSEGIVDDDVDAVPAARDDGLNVEIAS